MADMVNTLFLRNLDMQRAKQRGAKEDARFNHEAWMRMMAADQSAKKQAFDQRRQLVETQAKNAELLGRKADEVRERRLRPYQQAMQDQTKIQMIEAKAAADAKAKAAAEDARRFGVTESGKMSRAEMDLLGDRELREAMGPVREATAYDMTERGHMTKAKRLRPGDYWPPRSSSGSAKYPNTAWGRIMRGFEKDLATDVGITKSPTAIVMGGDEPKDRYSKSTSRQRKLDQGRVLTELPYFTEEDKNKLMTKISISENGLSDEEFKKAVMIGQGLKPGDPAMNPGGAQEEESTNKEEKELDDIMN